MLIAGGNRGDPSSERFDPATGISTATTGSLAVAGNSQSATLLEDGSVLVTGGYNGSALNAAQRYLPATDAWVSAGTLAVSRAAHTATLLPDGKVLIVGGVNSSAKPHRQCRAI